MSTPTKPDRAGDDLVLRVQAKRAEVERYLRAMNVRRRRLVTVTIVAGATATALTAAPALGGASLNGWLTETFHLVAPAWRILCALAAVCSLTAAVATQLHRSNNYEEHIARAQEIRANLEALEVAIACHHLPEGEAISQYLRAVEDTSFIEAVR